MLYGIKIAFATLTALGIVASASAGPLDFSKVTDAAKKKTWAVGAPGKGGIKTVGSFEAKTDVKVYRVWDGTAGKAGQWGKYWTDFPVPNAHMLRQGLAVCTEWNAGKKLTTCTLPAGTVVVRGGGQTATCADGKTLPGGKIQTVIFDAETTLTGCSTRAWAGARKPAAKGKGGATKRPTRKPTKKSAEE